MNHVEQMNRKLGFLPWVFGGVKSWILAFFAPEIFKIFVMGNLQLIFMFSGVAKYNQYFSRA